MSRQNRSSFLRRASGAVFCCATLGAAAAWAQPGPAHFDPLHPPSPQPAAHAVAVAASAVKILDVEGIDGRPYRLWLAAIGKPPATGYPVMYLLDGAAAMATLNAADASAAPTAPVLLVAVGYRSAGFIDPAARAYDYTPALANNEPTFDPRAPSRRGGGAANFLASLRGPIAHAVAQRWHVDAHRRGLWGHSYGGLFALHTLFTHGDAFDFYAATSPSLWWHAPLAENEARAFVTAPANGQHCLMLSNGTAEGRPRAPTDQAVQTSAPRFDDEQLATLLRGHAGLVASWRPLAGLSHGQTFSASIGPAIRDFAAWASGASHCGFDKD